MGVCVGGIAVGVGVGENTPVTALQDRLTIVMVKITVNIYGTRTNEYQVSTKVYLRNN